LEVVVPKHTHTLHRSDFKGENTLNHGRGRAGNAPIRLRMAELIQERLLPRWRLRCHRPRPSFEVIIRSCVGTFRW